MATLVEDLREWLAQETTAAVFRSLLAVQILELRVGGISPDLLEDVRSPLLDLYSLCLDRTGSEGDADV